MTTSQAVLSLSPTSCHVFIAIIEQNPCHRRLISWLMLPRVEKSLEPYVSVINKVLQWLAHGWLLGEDQKQGLLRQRFAFGSLEEAKGSRWETASGRCGQSQRAQPPLCNGTAVRDPRERRCNNHHHGERAARRHVFIPQFGELRIEYLLCRPAKRQWHELNGDRWKCLVKWSACVTDWQYVVDWAGVIS